MHQFFYKPSVDLVDSQWKFSWTSKTDYRVYIERTKSHTWQHDTEEEKVSDWLLSFKTYYKIKHQNNMVLGKEKTNYWLAQIEKPEIEPHTYLPNLWQRSKTNSMNKNLPFNKWCWNNWNPSLSKNPICRHRPYTLWKETKKPNPRPPKINKWTTTTKSLQLDHRTKCKIQNYKT